MSGSSTGFSSYSRPRRSPPRTGDAGLARFCLGEIEDWIDANPPFRGINWASGIELALRIVSILAVWGLVGEDHATPVQRRKVRACLNAHAYWLARYPSRHSSANNHLIAESGALFVLGTLWPELGIGGRAERARAVLIDQIGRQISDDGVGAEQSPTYTAFTLEWYLLCAEVAARSGTPFPKSVSKRLGEAGLFLRWITDEAGNFPRIGDDDEGRVLADVAAGQGDYVASILGSIASTLKRPNLAPPRVSPSLRNLYFGLPAVCPSGPKGAKIFSHGGYAVFRRRIAGRKPMMVMDHGPLGHLSIAAHGHADALALWLHIDDQPVLVDAGTYLYHSGGAWARSLPRYRFAQYAVPRRSELEPHRRCLQLEPESQLRADRMEKCARPHRGLRAPRRISRLSWSFARKTSDGACDRLHGA